MALEHALLVSLSERPASGLDLTRRFDASIGFFWTATHQQIYRVLGRMERDGWVSSIVVAQQGRPAKKVYDVTEPGRLELERWLASPAGPEPLRSELMVRFRGASYGDRAAVLATAREQLGLHRRQLALYREIEARDFPDPAALTGHDLDMHLVLRGGVLMEQFWIDWLTEYLTAHGGLDTVAARPARPPEDSAARPARPPEGSAARPARPPEDSAAPTDHLETTGDLT